MSHKSQPYVSQYAQVMLHNGASGKPGSGFRRGRARRRGNHQVEGRKEEVVVAENGNLLTRMQQFI